MTDSQIKPLKPLVTTTSAPLSRSEYESEGVLVAVDCEFDPESSKPELHYFFFIYTVTITNNSHREVQLIAREWQITDAQGHLDFVRGVGVVGQQPLIKPGHSYRYTSACELRTPIGMMEGHYLMKSEQQELLKITIAPFSLISNQQDHSPYLN